MWLSEITSSTFAFIGKVNLPFSMVCAQTAGSMSQILLVCMWVVPFALCAACVLVVLGRRPPKREGQRTRWCPGKRCTTRLMRIVRFGPFRPGCWYDLIDARADDDGNITCPECGRVLDASKSKLFRRRKPRLKLATACVVLMMGALGTSVYVVATSPSWVKVLPWALIGWPSLAWWRCARPAAGCR